MTWRRDLAMETASNRAKKSPPQSVKQFLFVFAPALLLPRLELFLCATKHGANARYAKAFFEGIFPLSGHKIDLIAQVVQRGVDRGRRQHQHAGFPTLLNYFLQ